MKPNHRFSSYLRHVVWVICPLLAAPLLAAGCSSTFFGGASIDSADIIAAGGAEQENPKGLLVGDMTILSGWNVVEIRTEGLATSLSGTGSNPGPSPQREALVVEMQRHDVRGIEMILGSPDTSMVQVAGLLPPGAEEGDRFDITVRVDRRSETTSLEGGWLLECRLRELAVLNGTVHEGHVLGLAKGAILVDSLVENGDGVLETRGRILGGGVVTKTRPLGLRLKSEYQLAKWSAIIGAAVNRRFQLLLGPEQEGVANPQTDKFIRLAVHPRYKQNLARYLRVVQSIPINEQPLERASRIERLRTELSEPETVATAALHLEALGAEGKQPLLEAIHNSNPLVRFYAAEALAYLNDAAAADVLLEAARREPAFRWHAMTALSAMDDVAARDALVTLLDETSAETRYGAFRSLMARDSDDALVRGRLLGGRYFYHTIPSSGLPMVHVSRSRRPEIVVFGEDLPLKTPLVLLVGSSVTIKSIGRDRLRVSRFASSTEDDKQIECSATLTELLRALGQLDVSYAQTVHLMQQARDKGYFEARLVFDALPTPGRTYYGERTEEPAGEISEEFAPELPLPGLFQAVPDLPSSEDAEERGDDLPEPGNTIAEETGERGEDPPRSRGLLGRIIGGDS